MKKKFTNLFFSNREMQVRQLLVTCCLLLVGILSAQNTFNGTTDDDWTDDDNWSGTAPYNPSSCTGGQSVNEELIIAANCDMSNANCLPSGRSYEFEKFVTVNSSVTWDINHSGKNFSIRGTGGLSNSGTMNINKGFESRKVSTNESTGIMNFNNGGSLNQSGSLVNNNMVNIISGTLEILNTGTFTNNAGSTIVVTSIIEHAGGTFTNNGFLKGIGEINSNGSTNLAGTIQPGNSVGTLSTRDDIVFSGTIEIEVDNGTSFDKITSNNSAALTISSATVQFIFNGTNYSNGQTFQVFNSFGSVTAPSSITNNNGYTIVHNGDGEFEITAGALPVELIEFTVRETNQSIDLQWRTASELNNEGFEIQHSADGTTWSNIAFVNGHGTTLEEQSYSYTDNRPLPGINYYRLKQIDFDGKFEYSPIVSVNLTNLQDLSNLRLFPNPATNNTVTLSIETDFTGEASFVLYDLLGQQMNRQSLNLESGSFNQSIDLSGIPSGVYMVEITAGNESWQERLVVE